MGIAFGTRFGRYEINSKIGAGGMGEVFLATDSKLDRQIALKILPNNVANNAERMRRFVQEAKLASALNHPNIITIHEIGEIDKTHFIATEYIEGETLHKRLKSEPMSLKLLLDVAIQIASALQAAHKAGIVHRDIKPENIMIRPDGLVKILDFGIAKLTEIKAASIDEEAITTLKAGTSPGMIMGTTNYMSPEQALGKNSDARSDLFSFGVVLYEMITGRQPFEGANPLEVIGSILNKIAAPIRKLVPAVPQEIERIINKLLRKDREERYQNAKDLFIDLKNARQELESQNKLERTVALNKSNVSSTSGSTKDAILLTEFDNLTGETIFDQTLKMALAFSLAQSSFLDILPETKVRQTLFLMGRSAGEGVTKELGYDICLRHNLKAFITGTISSFGTIYVLTLEAINARTGESLGRQFEQASSREEVLIALGQAATGLREQLGESLSLIEKYYLPAEYATTSSLEALKYFALGYEQQNTGKTLESIPFYKKALELDPKFASVYSGLASIYRNTNQWKLAAEMSVKAFELRDTVSENEKFRITFFYYSFVTGEIDKAIDTLDLWRKTYSSQLAAAINFSDCFERVGKSEKAVAIAREGLQIDANDAVIYMNLAESLLSLDRYAEVKEICRQAFEKKFDGDSFHRFLYIVAFIEIDTTAIAEHLAWFSGRTDEYLAFNLQTGAAAFQGRRHRAQDSARRAIDLASRSDAKEVAAQYAAEQALRIVFWNSGTGLPSADDSQLKALLKTQTNNALKLERSNLTLSLAALALALAGQTTEAKSLAQELSKERPKDTLINELWLPTIRAAIELQNGRAKKAIKELEIAERFERSAEFYPQYIRGLAYLKLNKTKQSVAEFEKILKHRGEAALSSIYPLAQLGKARAMKDKTEYERFFELWKEADKDIPSLVAAKNEIAKLR
jgi:serine/threonine protein kinase/Tfp pilus assembly protein PilF